MKRIARRTLGAILGIALGWYVAGIAPSLIPGMRMSLAEDLSHHHATGTTPGAPEAATTTQPSVESSEPAAPVEAAHEEEGAQAGRHAADELVPSQPEQQIKWFWPVIWAAAGLFIAAVVLGVPSLKLRGPLPPDPAETTHDNDHAAHDDHAKPGHH